MPSRHIESLLLEYLSLKYLLDIFSQNFNQLFESSVSRNLQHFMDIRQSVFELQLNQVIANFHLLLQPSSPYQIIFCS